jgi:hypothetical protein
MISGVSQLEIIVSEYTRPYIRGNGNRVQIRCLKDEITIISRIGKMAHVGAFARARHADYFMNGAYLIFGRGHEDQYPVCTLKDHLGSF